MFFFTRDSLSLNKRDSLPNPSRERQPGNRSLVLYRPTCAKKNKKFRVVHGFSRVTATQRQKLQTVLADSCLRRNDAFNPHAITSFPRRRESRKQYTFPNTLVSARRLVLWAKSTLGTTTAIVLIGLVLITAGCATKRDIHQFEPVPVAEVDAEELEPEVLPSALELLKSANEAFEAANAAQQEGRQAAALRQYTLMLEMLIEADLDPGVFYNLRDEFGKILSASTQYASLYDRIEPEEWKAAERRPGTVGELDVQFPLHERVIAEIEEIQKVYPRNFQNGLNRSTKYAPYIRRELAKAGLPEELMWLAMVESQFTPKIISRAGAGGMWQFMRSTGRRYNLRMDSYVDERFDWEKSTKAAIAHLKDLHEMFGSWPLAISAYNMGEGGLERAIAANGGERDLWKLLDTPPASYHIRRETKKFYAKFLASAIVARNPERYGFEIERQSPEEVIRVPVTDSYSLAAIEKASGLPEDTLVRLNPHLIRGVTPHGEYPLCVPASARKTVLAALDKVPTVRYASAGPGGTHVVHRGETLSHIARRYGVSTRDLIRLNDIRSPHRLQIGRKLALPGGARGAGVSTTSDGKRVYRVRRGDTLYEIARAESVTVSQLQRWNHLGSRSRIYVGQQIYVSQPGAAPDDMEVSADKYVHVVRAGEYPAKIARHYGVELDDFLRWNNLTKSSMIQIGDKLTIYRNGTAEKAHAAGDREDAGTLPSTLKTFKKIHKVAKGENPSVIAAKYGVPTRQFLAWNKLSPSSILHVGRECVVYVPGEGAGEDDDAGVGDETESASAPTDRERIIHVVAKGHNPTTIARRYGVRLSELFKWNGWSETPLLHIGDKVIIYKD